MSASHLVKGLLILGERWTSGPRKWAGEGSGIVDKAVRVAMLAGVGLVAFRVLTLSWPVLGITVLIVVILALRAATKAGKAEPAPAEAVSATGLPEVSGDAFLALLHEVLGAATGVHLRTLAAALTHRVGGAWEVADVRALCEAVGQPTRPTVRAPGGGPTVGVHRDDLLPLPRVLPEGAVVDPGLPLRPATTSSTTAPTTTGPTTPATPTTRRVGDLRIVAVDDPDNPARTHVTVISNTRKRL